MQKKIISYLTVFCFLFVCTISVAGLTSCSSAPKQQPQQEEQVAEEAPVEEVKDEVVDAVEEFNKFAANNAVYFAFDSSAVNKNDIINTYKEQFEKLGELKEIKLTVSGYCDPRGSVEYNMKLGKRRALAVKKAIENVVKNDVKIEVISYGKNKYAKYSDNLIENYRKNRRVEIFASR